jgi:hypothetical protein
LSVLLLLYSISFDPRLLVWELTRQNFHQLVVFDLSPTKIASFHFLFVVLRPPISIFKPGPDHDGVVSFADEVFVNHSGMRQCYDTVLRYRRKVERLLN